MFGVYCPSSLGPSPYRALLRHKSGSLPSVWLESATLRERGLAGSSATTVQNPPGGTSLVAKNALPIILLSIPWRILS